MKPVFEIAQDRREFLKSAARYSLLGGAMALAYALSLKRTGDPSNCIKIGVCQSCAALRGCQQPQAQAERAKIS